VLNGLTKKRTESAGALNTARSRPARNSRFAQRIARATCRPSKCVKSQLQMKIDNLVDHVQRALPSRSARLCPRHLRLQQDLAGELKRRGQSGGRSSRDAGADAVPETIVSLAETSPADIDQFIADLTSAAR